MKATILSNHPVAEGYYRLAFRLSHPSATVEPGQFFMVRPVSDSEYDPLLPRPFSVYRNPSPGEVEILYKVIGRGTEILSGKREGDLLHATGPFGNTFPLPAAGETQEILLVGGGIGVAPLVNLVEALRRTSGEIPLIAFIGGRTRDDLLAVDDFIDMGCRVISATEDGSIGIRGYVTEALERHLSEGKRRRIVYACGPHPMLKALANLLLPTGIPAYFSLEAVMACGMGLCMGCAERGIVEKYPLVCQDGPVFRADAIQWNR